MPWCYRVVIGKIKSEIKSRSFETSRFRKIDINNHTTTIPKVEHTEVSTWFKEGDSIQLAQDMFNQMVDDALESLAQ